MRTIVNKPKRKNGNPVLDLGYGSSKQTEKTESGGPSGYSFPATNARNGSERADIVADSRLAKISSSRIDCSLDASWTVFAGTLFRCRLNCSKCLHWLAHVCVLAVT